MSERPNKGALLLQEKTKERGGKADLARKMEVEPDVVTRWVNGDRIPNTLHRRQLEDDFGISWRLWDDESDSGDVEQPPAAE
jgi:ribosome-binding protein aMBF1 (putative translation factor)